MVTLSFQLCVGHSSLYLVKGLLLLEMSIDKRILDHVTRIDNDTRILLIGIDLLIESLWMLMYSDIQSTTPNSDHHKSPANFTTLSQVQGQILPFHHFTIAGQFGSINAFMATISFTKKKNVASFTQQTLADLHCLHWCNSIHPLHCVRLLLWLLMVRLMAVLVNYQDHCLLPILLIDCHISIGFCSTSYPKAYPSLRTPPQANTPFGYCGVNI